MHDYVCDWCSCDHTALCQKHAAEFDRLAEFYYEICGETQGNRIHLQYDIIRQICAFVMESPDFFRSHPDVRDAIADSLHELLEESIMQPLYSLLHETLALIQ
jgi:hypothetical protein